MKNAASYLAVVPYNKIIVLIVHLCYLLLPLVVWTTHFYPTVTMKEFVFHVSSTLCITLMLVSKLISGDYGYKPSRLQFTVLLFLIYCTVSLMFHDYSDYYYYTIMLMQMAMFFTIQSVFDEKAISRVLNILLVTSFISSIFAIMQYLGFNFSQVDGGHVSIGERVTAFLGNANLVGGFCVLTIPISVAFAIKAKEEIKGTAILYALFACLSLIQLLLSRSRGSWIACTLSLMIFIFVKYKRNVSISTILTKKTLTLLCFFALVFAAVVYPLNFSNSLDGSLLSIGSLRIRLYYYLCTVKMISNDIIFGRGLNTFNVFFPEYCNNRMAYHLKDFIANFRVEHAHNEHLELINDLGVIGYILFAAIILTSLCNLLRKNEVISLGIAAAIIGILIDGLLSQNLRFTAISSILWLFIALPTTPLQYKKPQALKLSPVKLFVTFMCILGMFFQFKYALNIKDSGYYTKLGLNCSVEGEKDALRDSINYLYKAYSLDKHNKRVVYALANAHMAVGEDDKALYFYKALLAEDPNFVQANFKIANVYIDKQRFQDAKAYLVKETKINNMHWQAYYMLSFVCRKTNDIAGALNNLEEVRKINAIKPIEARNYIDALKTLGSLYLELGASDKVSEIQMEINAVGKGITWDERTPQPSKS